MQNGQTDPRTACRSLLCRKSPLSRVGTSYSQGRSMLQHWLIDLIGHVSGLSDAQLRQIETSLPATKALIDLLNRAQPMVEQAQSLYAEAQPLIDEAKKEWQTVGPAAQILIDVISHHVDKGRSPAEAAETVRTALDGSTKSVAQHDERSVEAAVAGADGVVNAISLYVEHGRDTFHSVHVEAAARIARAARRAGTKRFVHLSGIGADAGSPSPYIRSRGEGETAAQTAFPGAVIIRAAVMFAPDDPFLRQFSGCFGPCRLIRCSATGGRGSSQRTRTTLPRRSQKSCDRARNRTLSTNWPVRASIHTRSCCGPLPVAEVCGRC